MHILHSFKDEVFVDFTVNDNAPETEGYFKTPSGTRLSKLETVVGPNAAGKSNLLKVIPFMRSLIAYSYSRDPDDKIPFQCSKGNKEPSELEVVFEVEDKIYTYSFTLDHERIWEEDLKVTSMAKTKNQRKIFLTVNGIAKKGLHSYRQQLCTS